MDYGRHVIGSTGMPIQVAVGGPSDTEWGQGITLDWTKVGTTGNGQPILNEGLTVPSGALYLPYGSVLTKITNQPVWTVTITGTAGAWSLLVQRPDTLAYVQTAALSYECTAAQVQAAIVAALQGAQGGNLPFPIAVTGTTGTAGAPSGPFTITSPVTVLSDSVSAAGLTAGSVTVVNTTVVGNYGKYGPYDPNATDGRQNLTNGEVGILNNTVLQNGIFGFTQVATDHPPLIRGGKVWKLRVIANNTANSLANGPTWANLLAAMPRLQPVEGSA